MQLTPQILMRMGVGFVLSGFVGWYIARQQGPSIGTSVLSINEKAPLVTIGGNSVSLEQLDSESKFELEKIAAQFVLQAQNLALRQAALNDLAQTSGKKPRWRDVLANDISDTGLQKVYSEYPSFNQSGSFAAMRNEVERFVLNQERNKKLGAFIETNMGARKIKFPQPATLQLQFPFSMDEFPLVLVGDPALPKTPEVQIVFRYAGQVSNTAFSLLTAAARDNQRSIPVRLIPEWTPSDYDLTSLSYLHGLARTKSASELEKVHAVMLKNSPALSDLQNPAAIAGALDKMKKGLAELGVSSPFGPHSSEQLRFIAEWYRDVRSNQLPLFFVDKTLVSETHPRGLDMALLEALKL